MLDAMSATVNVLFTQTLTLLRAFSPNVKNGSLLPVTLKCKSPKTLHTVLHEGFI